MSIAVSSFFLMTFSKIVSVFIMKNVFLRYALCFTSRKLTMPLDSEAYRQSHNNQER